MMKRSYLVLAAALLAASMWIWVLHVPIPHQPTEAAELGIPRGNFSDLYPRWLGARELLLHGRNPYGADITREIQQGFYGRPIDPMRPNDPRDQEGFAYPLYVVFVLAPTVELPFAVVQKAFIALLVSLTAGSVLLWMNALEWRPSLAARLTWIILVLSSFPAIWGFILQQLTLLVFALVAAAMYAITRRYFVWAGILLALATIKPQLVALLIVWLGIWVCAAWRERQQLWWSFAATLIALVAGAEFLLPGWIPQFRAAVAEYYNYTGGGKSLFDLALGTLVGRTLALVLVIISLILVCRDRHGDEQSSQFRQSLALVLATTLTIIPFAPYNQVLLVPAVMLLIVNAQPLWSKNQMSRSLLAVAGVSIGWPWVAAAAFNLARLFLPAHAVQQAWSVPIYTSFAIPVTVVAVLLVNANFRSSTTANMGR
jgi:hypothetical protein